MTSPRRKAYCAAYVAGKAVGADFVFNPDFSVSPLGVITLDPSEEPDLLGRTDVVSPRPEILGRGDAGGNRAEADRGL